ncbi:homoprotocatechuate degradation operon regulator HpaR [Rhodovulum sp. DZ06]|uniref:homoprotocatechuate degradation operon regulator HpaR n=1 Tax=Rhodovulum sp. DZ06 TaxID=3425126 RepID=UPI003D34CDF5
MPSDGPSDFFHPSDVTGSLPIALLRARESVMQRFRPMLASHGLTEQQWRVLRTLGAHAELEVSQLAERSVILGPSLSRILRNFESQGLVKKRQDEADRRRYWLSLSEEGRAVIARVQPDSERIYAEIEAVLGAEAMRKMVGELNAITDRLRLD